MNILLFFLCGNFSRCFLLLIFELMMELEIKHLMICVCLIFSWKFVYKEVVDSIEIALFGPKWPKTS